MSMYNTLDWNNNLSFHNSVVTLNTKTASSFHNLPNHKIF